jgi:hypothetical protein
VPPGAFLRVAKLVVRKMTKIASDLSHLQDSLFSANQIQGAGMQNIKACFYVRPEDRTELERLVADGNTAQKITTRARIVLASGQRGLGANAIMQEARTSKPSVWRWQERHMEAGIRGPLKGKGKGKRAGAQAQNHYQDRTGKADQCHALECAHDGQGDDRQPHHRPTHLEGERAQAASHAHLQALERFAFRREGARYRRALSQPTRQGAVLSVDEKSQIQLDRTQPDLPLKKAVPAR